MEDDYTELTCPECGEVFWVANDYNGVITCPYCGDYVEG